MALAKFRKTSNKIGNGRFVVSEGVAPSSYLLPHENLPTIFKDEEDDRFEIVVAKGTILSAIRSAATNWDTRLVPANGSAAAVTHNDGQGNTIVVPALSTPIGAAQYNLYRPFDRGTSQGAGWITHGYVEWPVIQGVNDDLEPGMLVRSNGAGIPVRLDPAAIDGTNAWYLAVGKVIEVEDLGVNYDSGLLEYLRLTGDAAHMSDPLFNVASAGPHQGFKGIRTNLDVVNVVGAVRVALTI